MLKKYQNILAWALGFGIVSFAFRNYYFQGTYIGLAICTIVLFFILLMYRYDKDRPKNILGSKFVYIPLILISLSIIISGISVYIGNGDINILLTRVTIAIIFFGVYLASRIFGEKVLKPFALAVVVENTSLILYSIILYRVHNGGFASMLDYNTAIGLLIIGAIVSVWKKQWVIVAIASVGVFLTGSEEGLFVLAIILLTIIIRRDFSRRILFPIGAILIIAVLGLVPFNYTRTIYAVPIDKVTELISHKHNEQSIIVASNPENHTDVAIPSKFNIPFDFVLNGRLSFSKIGLDNWNWLGSGYVLNPVDLKDYAIYNVPLVVAQQIGIVGGLAWIFVTIYCLVKTKWKYAFIAILALSCFDNYIFCQLGIFWWSLAGVSTVSMRKSDLIFKGVN